MTQQYTTAVEQEMKQERAIAKPLQLVAAFVLGGAIIYGAGFVNTAAVHNAAHDTRHSQGFPCH